MGVRRVAFAVFLVPIVISIAFGSYVMAEILNEPDRELNLLPFTFPEKTTVKSIGGISLTSLQNVYLSGTPINIGVSITDPFFDCGDLYFTLYTLNTEPKQVLTQNAYFEQCFDSGVLLPIDDEFSEIISKPGNYELVVEMHDKEYTKTISATAKFTVN